MSPQTKDIIDAVSKVAGVLAFMVAAIGLLASLKKNRDERRKDREQRERQAAESRTAAEKYQEQRALQLAQVQQQLQQIQQSQKISEARFWLELRRMFGEYNDVHVRLRGGNSSSDWPRTAEEWARVEAYMGLFEHCGRMLQDKLIGIQTFKNLYGYRVGNILKNPRIVKEKLIERGKDWQDFIELVTLTGREIPKPKDESTHSSSQPASTSAA